MTDKDEWKRKARYHAGAANDYATSSHEYSGEISDAYSALSEAHGAVSRAFAKKAGLSPEWGFENQQT